MKAFHELLTPQAAREAFGKAFAPAPLGSEHVPLTGALGRVLARELRAEADLPSFARSTVDGFAVCAADTARAEAGKPVRLRVVAEVLMGQLTPTQVDAQQSVRIPTGGAVPAGADAVIMQEHIVRHDQAITVERVVQVGENVTPRGADVRAGEVVLVPGTLLRAQELGMLAGLGHSIAEVYVRPGVGLMVTGDEIVPPGEPLSGAQIYDINTYTLGALIGSAGGVAQSYGIVRDNLAVLAHTAKQALETSHALIVVGGSSVGEKDVVADAITALGDPGIIVHGISIRPGKPTILAVARGKPVFGLPGNPVSAMVVYDQFVRPVIERMAGRQESAGHARFVRARIASRLSAGNREDHVRVALRREGSELWATAVPGGSGIITSMVRAEGIVVVPANATIERGTEVEVRLFE